MVRLTVWAPHAREMELECAGKKEAMKKGEGGWWSIDASQVSHGVSYAFLVDEDGPYPDPRSFWQPQGVHGPSCWVDHSRFSWSDATWKEQHDSEKLGVESAIFYELLLLLLSHHISRAY